MLIPIVIFVACFCAAVFASSRWLPDLATGTVGGLAFFVVCGLLGAALAVAGLNIYTIVKQAEDFGGIDRSGLVAGRLIEMLWQAGSLLGLAMAVYLLAPRAETAERSAIGPAA
jgi:hypothetical protein